MRRIINHAPSQSLDYPQGRTRIDTTAETHVHRCQTCGRETETDMRAECIRILRAHTLGCDRQDGPARPGTGGPTG